MSYLGETNQFSFRDNFCEPISEHNAGTLAAANLGQIVALNFKNAAVGFQNNNSKHIALALASGIAEAGKNVFLCEMTDLPSFRYGLPLINADCGIFITGDSKDKFNFFGRCAFPLSKQKMQDIIDSDYDKVPPAAGKIISITSLNELYADNLTNSIDHQNLPINAGISCGNTQIRTLWQRFFYPVNDDLTFQISEHGQRVNAYSTEFGFISHEKLTLSYALSLWKKGQAVFLPETFHYIADQTAEENGYSLIRFDPNVTIPEEAFSQRFLHDPLFMCLNLMSSFAEFAGLLRDLPQFVSVRHEIYFSSQTAPELRADLNYSSGKIHVTRSGKNHLTLLVQAQDAETAEEICSDWEENFRRSNPYI